MCAALIIELDLQLLHVRAFASDHRKASASLVRVLAINASRVT